MIHNLGENPGIDGQNITIILLEPLLHNWSVRGGKLANQVDFGFDVNVLFMFFHI
jgi:hypothetical protein